VLLRVELDASGKPQQVHVEQSQPAGVFDQAAIEAVQSWTFNPSQRDDRPVESVVQVPIRFEGTEAGAAASNPEGALDAI